MIPGLSTIKLIGIGIAAFLLLGLIAERGRWMHRAHNAETELATICAAVRAAADNPKMDCKRAAQQIGLMGQDIVNLKVGIAHQNAAVSALNVESERQKAEAARASQNARVRANAAEATAERLRASARSSTPSRACEPSKTLQEAWQ
jgi:hypothetical protein